MKTISIRLNENYLEKLNEIKQNYPSTFVKTMNTTDLIKLCIINLHEEIMTQQKNR